MPMVDVILTAPTRTASAQHQAIIDSGSDGTLIPIDVLETIGARYVGEARIRGVIGDSQRVDVYVVTAQIGSHIVRGIRAVASPSNSEIILGRNAINQLVITLNGLANTTEILD